MHNPRIKYKRSKNVFDVTFVALILGRDWPRLLESHAQYLIGSPGDGTGTWPDYLVKSDYQKNEGPFGEKNCTKIEK